MRRRKLFSWVLVLSPALLLAWIGVSARVTKIGKTEFAADPAGFEESLRHYNDVLAVSEKVKLLASGPTSSQSLETILNSTDTLSTVRLEPVALRYGFSADVDARRPLVLAQENIRAGIHHQIAYCVDNNDHSAVAKLLLTDLYTNLLLRYGDCQSLTRSSNFSYSTLRRVEDNAQYISVPEIESLIKSLMQIDARASRLDEMIRRNFELYVARNNRFPDEWQRTDANQIAAQAYRAVRASESLEPLMARVSQWESSEEGEVLLSLLVAWDGAITSEAKYRRGLRNTIVRLASISSRKQGIDPRIVAHLKLPAEFLRDPVTGEPAQLSFAGMTPTLKFRKNYAPALTAVR